MNMNDEYTASLMPTLTTATYPAPQSTSIVDGKYNEDDYGVSQEISGDIPNAIDSIDLMVSSLLEPHEGSIAENEMRFSGNMRSSTSIATRISDTTQASLALSFDIDAMFRNENLKDSQLVDGSDLSISLLDECSGSHRISTNRPSKSVSNASASTHHNSVPSWGSSKTNGKTRKISTPSKEQEMMTDSSAMNKDESKYKITPLFSDYQANPTNNAYETSVHDLAVSNGADCCISMTQYDQCNMNESESKHSIINVPSSYIDFSRIPDEALADHSAPLIGEKYHSILESGGDPSYVIETDSIVVTRGRNIRTFPMKLYDMLSSTNPADDVEQGICWLPHGRSFHVINQNYFVEYVLPKFFKKVKFSSFTRQLQLWGFKRMKDSSYYHQCFLRGRMNLVDWVGLQAKQQKIQKSSFFFKAAVWMKGSSNTMGKMTSIQEEEPDFNQLALYRPLSNPKRFHENENKNSDRRDFGNNYIYSRPINLSSNNPITPINMEHAPRCSPQDVSYQKAGNEFHVESSQLNYEDHAMRDSQNYYEGMQSMGNTIAKPFAPSLPTQQQMYTQFPTGRQPSNQWYGASEQPGQRRHFSSPPVSMFHKDYSSLPYMHSYTCINQPVFHQQGNLQVTSQYTSPQLVLGQRKRAMRRHSMFENTSTHLEPSQSNHIDTPYKSVRRGNIDPGQLHDDPYTPFEVNEGDIMHSLSTDRNSYVTNIGESSHSSYLSSNVMKRRKSC